MLVDRVDQARAYWNKGWGKELGIDCFETYLATIPEIPNWPASWKQRFDRVILVDARLPLTKCCALAGLSFSGSDATFVDHESVPARPAVYWLNCQDGRRNFGRSAAACRQSFPADERGLTAIEGTALYLQSSRVRWRFMTDLPGSVSGDVGALKEVAFMVESSSYTGWDSYMGDGDVEALIRSHVWRARIDSRPDDWSCVCIGSASAGVER